MFYESLYKESKQRGKVSEMAAKFCVQHGILSTEEANDIMHRWAWGVKKEMKKEPKSSVKKESTKEVKNEPKSQVKKEPKTEVKKESNSSSTTNNTTVKRERPNADLDDEAPLSSIKKAKV
jgi:hypothetical protein